MLVHCYNQTYFFYRTRKFCGGREVTGRSDDIPHLPAADPPLPFTSVIVIHGARVPHGDHRGQEEEGALLRKVFEVWWVQQELERVLQGLQLLQQG